MLIPNLGSKPNLEFNFSWFLFIFFFRLVPGLTTSTVFWPDRNLPTYFAHIWAERHAKGVFDWVQHWVLTILLRNISELISGLQVSETGFWKELPKYRIQKWPWKTNLISRYFWKRNSADFKPFQKSISEINVKISFLGSETFLGTMVQAL